jgi:hypothetical protein
MQALRYSQYNPFGTARFAAQGGAIGALGGDFSSVLVNPAGLAFYRSSEMTLSPAFYWVNTSSQFMGRSTDDSQLRFTVGNIGLVQATTSDSKSGIVSASYAVGYNTLVNFNNNTLTYGTNTNSSLLDDFTWHANADPNNLNSYYEQLAFDAFLMPFDSTAGEYWHDMQLDGYGQEVNRSSEQSGYIGEYSLSGALNISNLIYMGASFGIHSLRFYEDIYHIETDMDDHVLDFNSFRFREYNSTEGWGYTFRMGMIVRPVQMIRVGASFQLPTYYSLTDQKVTDIKSYWDNGSGIPETSETSPNGIYDYKLRTPFRVNAHASLILLKMATISAAYEFVDYSSSKLDTYDYKFFEENDRIRQDFQAAHNVKMGAEVRTGSLYFRGGAQYLRSPFVDERNNAESWILGGGLGVRSKSVYLDMSYTHAGRTDVYGMYAFEPGSNEVAINETNSNNLMLTVGVKF